MIENSRFESWFSVNYINLRQELIFCLGFSYISRNEPDKIGLSSAIVVLTNDDHWCIHRVQNPVVDPAAVALIPHSDWLTKRGEIPNTDDATRQIEQCDMNIDTTLAVELAPVQLGSVCGTRGPGRLATSTLQAPACIAWLRRWQDMRH